VWLLFIECLLLLMLSLVEGLSQGLAKSELCLLLLLMLSLVEGLSRGLAKSELLCL
jgi:hypothetical protein